MFESSLWISDVQVEDILTGTEGWDHIWFDYGGSFQNEKEE